MTTQVSFVADKNLKDQALEKARREGITLKALLIQAMKGYIAGDISLSIKTARREIGIEEVHFADSAINDKAVKLAKLLR